MIAINNEAQYSVRYWLEFSFSPCYIPYQNRELYVRGLAALPMVPNSDTFSFVQIGQKKKSKKVILSLHTMSIADCGKTIAVTAFNETIWEGRHQQSILLKVNPQETYAYVFADSFTLSYDLMTNKIQTNIGTFNGTDQELIVPISFDLTNELAFVVVHSPSKYIITEDIYFYFYQLQPNISILCGHIPLKDLFFMSYPPAYNPAHGISVSVHRSGKQILVGSAQMNDIFMIIFDNATRNCISKIIHFHLQPILRRSNLVFGSSVAWLDDQDTFAVLVRGVKNQMDSNFEIYIYKNIGLIMGSYVAYLDFILPNKQQRFSFNSYFPIMFSRSNSLFIFDNSKKCLHIQSAAAGNAPMYETMYV
ncbi:unnamed protein product [Rotaria socialis]